MDPSADNYKAAGIASPMHPLPPVTPLANQAAIDPQTLIEVVQRVFGQYLCPLDCTSHQRSYPDWVGATMPLPYNFRVTEFILFSSEDGRSSVEDISGFTAQFDEPGYNDWHKLQLFSLPLTGAAFSQYSALPPNSVQSWQDLERAFHDRFYSPPDEFTLLNLMSSRKKIDESAVEYIEHFRQLKSRCNVQIPDAQAMNIAVKNMHP
ncbi:uncharacterized protein LOC127265065 [Andrographis paniculata]|uniref:uncharacterized protein LOC127265065 n=1 Tax=Andrographis paniculata TaxID=175694 RepID=UPI0021E82D79|nr:uncharacterized protein LOC127265065 [Andrographis paniculata]